MCMLAVMNVLVNNGPRIVNYNELFITTYIHI